MNKSHDYRALEREFVASQISLRELCRRHDISAHSLVTVQAKKHKWAENVAILLDRLMVLFERPARISECRDLNVSSELPIDALKQIVELTLGKAGPPRTEESPLTRTRRLDD